MKVRIFDVCVMGRSIGGLVAALMLQRRGTKLLVLSRKDPPGVDPTLCEFLCGFTLKPMLKRVGFHPTEVNSIPLLDSPLQAIFPGRRLDCHGDEDRFGWELQREFPERSQKILQLFKESYGHIEVYQHLFNSRAAFPPRGYFAKREFMKTITQICDPQLLEDRPLVNELRAFDVGEEFETTIKALELALTSLVTSWTSGAHLAHLLTLSRWEGFNTPMGVVDLRNMLLHKITDRGGVVAECNEFTELESDRNRISGLRMKGSDWDEVRWQAAVIGGDPRGLISMARDGKFSAWQKELDELPVYARKAFQILKVKPEGIPVGMKIQGLIMPEKRTEGGAERRERVRALRYTLRWDDLDSKNLKVILAITAFLPPFSDRPEPKQLGMEIRAHLKSIIPFLDQYLVEEPPLPFVPHPEGTPGDFHQRFIYTTENPTLLSICGVNPETPFKNVFHAGDMVFPGLGLDGEILAGLQAAHSVGKLFGESA